MQRLLLFTRLRFKQAGIEACESAAYRRVFFMALWLQIFRIKSIKPQDYFKFLSMDSFAHPL